MKEIALTQGKVTVVDDADFEWLNQYQWFAHKERKNYYAARNIHHNGKRTLSRMHREILGLESGDKILTDHANRDSLDNRRFNLRTVDYSMNGYNEEPRKTNKSGYRGVSWHSKNKRWRIQMRFNGCLLHGGEYKNISEAVEAYKAMAMKYRGADAVLPEEA